MMELHLKRQQHKDKPRAWQRGWSDTLADPDSCQCPYRLNTQERRDWQDGNSECIEVLNFLAEVI